MPFHYDWIMDLTSTLISPLHEVLPRKFSTCNKMYLLTSPISVTKHVFISHFLTFQCPFTHWGRVTHICVSNQTTICSVNGLSPGRRSHYLNKCWNIVNWTFRDKLQWNINRNSNSSIHENAFESIVCEMTAILFRSQCVKIFNSSTIWVNEKFCCCILCRYLKIFIFVIDEICMIQLVNKLWLDTV